MSDIVGFWDGLGFNGYLLVLLLVLFCVFLINLIYRTVVVLTKDTTTIQDNGVGVSVIITSNNKADYLRENLKYFLEQDYSNFEVVVVNECSEDDTVDVLADFQQMYPNLKTTRIFPDTKFHCTKKIAINIGVLAASNDILLFSEINCRPFSRNWIKTMQAHFDQNTAVVLGEANYETKKGIISIKRMFRFMWFLRMVLLIKGKCNIYGDGCNMAYRKRYYIENRGYTHDSQVYMGYNTDLVKALSDKGKVKVVKNESGKIIINDTRKKVWIEDYSYYYSNKAEWSFWHLVLADMDVFVKYSVYILSIYLIISGILYEYVAILLLLTFLMDFIAINVYAKQLKQKNLFLTSFIISMVGLVYRAYYNVYSAFTKKKWR